MPPEETRPRYHFCARAPCARRPRVAGRQHKLSGCPASVKQGVPKHPVHQTHAQSTGEVHESQAKHDQQEALEEEDRDTDLLSVVVLLYTSSNKLANQCHLDPLLLAASPRAPASEQRAINGCFWHVHCSEK